MAYNVPKASGGITEYFSAYLSSPTGSVTGDGTLYGPIIFNSTLSNTGNYNTATGIYTAPTTGQYAFQTTITFTGGNSSTTNYLLILNGSVTSVRSFQIPANVTLDSTVILSANFFIPMTAGDTMSVNVDVGGVNKDVSIYGATPTSFATTSLFSGFKVA
jgi:hypothetical protein